MVLPTMTGWSRAWLVGVACSACATRATVHPSASAANEPVASGSARDKAGPEAEPHGQKVSTKGFELYLPDAWRVTDAPLGITAASADGAIELVVSGAYPVADLPAHRLILEDQGIAPQAWSEREHGGRRLLTASSTGATSLAVHIVADGRAHVLVTVESREPLDEANAAIVRAAIEGLRIGEIVISNQTAPSAIVCSESTLQWAEAAGAICLEAAVLGEDVVRACAERLGWHRDPGAEAAIGGKTGKTLECYSRAKPAGRSRAQ